MSIDVIPAVMSPASEDACGFYRMLMPSLNIPGVDYYFQGWDEQGKPKSMDLARIQHRKVIVVQRQASIYNLRAIKNMQAMGLKVIYDLDDNLWNIPHGNPAKKVFEAHQAGFAMCAKEADLLTVSTQGLKAATGTSFPINKILIVPNAIDFKLFRYKDIKRDDDRVVIGWGGSNTHNDDVKDVFNIIPEILDKCPKAIMEIAGAPPMSEVKQYVKILDILKREEKGEMKPYALLITDLKTGQREEVPWFQFKSSIVVDPMTKRKIRTEIKVGVVLQRDVLIQSELGKHKQYRFKPWVPIREYANRFSSWAWDIAIAPLEDVRFNKSKSNIKMLEAAAVKIPCLVSNIQPYNEFCHLGGDLKWLLCNSIDDWKSKLITLINEPERRAYLGQKMYDTAKKFYDIQVIRHTWEHAFKMALQ